MLSKFPPSSLETQFTRVTVIPPIQVFFHIVKARSGLYVYVCGNLIPALSSEANELKVKVNSV